MRIIRWFLILSSVAYWYSVFAMEPMDEPLRITKRRAEIPTSILEEEAGINWQNVPSSPVRHYYADTTALILSDLSEEENEDEPSQTVSKIIMIATQAPNIHAAIAQANNKLARHPEINPLEFGPGIAQALAKKFKTPWLYVAAGLKPANRSDALINYLDPKETVASEKLKAIKASIQLNDMNALYTMLNNQSYKQLFTRTNFGPHDTLLAEVAKEGKIDAMKLLLAAGANVGSTYTDHSLLQNAYPNLELISLLVEKGARRDTEEIFTKLAQIADPNIKNSPLYYPTLIAIVKARNSMFVNPKNTKDINFNPLIISAKAGNLELFKLLLYGTGIAGHLRGEAKLFVSNPGTQIPHKQAFIDLFAE